MLFAPIADEAVPIGHSVHSDCSVALAKEPAPQSVQLAAPKKALDPAGQG